MCLQETLQHKIIEEGVQNSYSRFKILKDNNPNHLIIVPQIMCVCVCVCVCVHLLKILKAFNQVL